MSTSLRPTPSLRPLAPCPAALPPLRRLAPCLAALPLLLAACTARAVLPSYAARTYFPHKDIACVSVYLDRKLTVDEYREIADRELEKLLVTPPPDGVPVYEVRFEFFLPEVPSPLRKRVAQIAVRPPRDPTLARGTPPPELILY